MRSRNVLLKNNVNQHGEGQSALVFAHGFGCDQSIWHKVAPAFYDSHEVVLFDYVGSGNSDLNYYDSERYQHLSAYATDLAEVLEALDLYDVTLITHSISGSVAALAYSHIKKRLRQIIMLNPSPRYLHDEPHYKSGFSEQDVDQLLEYMESDFQGWAHDLAPKVMENHDSPGLTEELVQQFRAGESRMKRDFARATFYSDVRECLHQIDCPVALLQASKDIVVPHHIADYMLHQLPNARFVELDARGHYPHVSAADTVIEQIKRACAN